VGRRYSFSGYFTPFFDEIARKSSRSGEKSSMKGKKLTILGFGRARSEKFFSFQGSILFVLATCDSYNDDEGA
jgi:hypothetical protein